MLNGFCKMTTKSFISCCFILALTSADIIFHKFLELHSTLSEKKDFRYEFPFLTDSHKPPQMKMMKYQNSTKKHQRIKKWI